MYMFALCFFSLTFVSIVPCWAVFFCFFFRSLLWRFITQAHCTHITYAHRKALSLSLVHTYIPQEAPSLLDDIRNAGKTGVLKNNKKRKVKEAPKGNNDDMGVMALLQRRDDLMGGSEESDSSSDSGFGSDSD